MSEITEYSGEITNIMKFEIDESYDAELEYLQRKTEQSATSLLLVSEVNAETFHLHDVEIKQEVDESEPIISEQSAETDASSHNPPKVWIKQEVDEPEPIISEQSAETDDASSHNPPKVRIKQEVDEPEPIISEQSAETDDASSHNPPKAKIKQRVAKAKSGSRDPLNVNQRVKLQRKVSQRHKEVIPVYQCDQCHKIFKSKPYFKRHIRQVHSKLFHFKCNICEGTFKSDVALQRHLSKHRLNPAYKCESCVMSFYSPGELEKHNSLIHKESISNCGEIFACSFCNKTFNQQIFLDVHIRTHNGRKPFKCQHCYKPFATHRILYHHHCVSHAKENKFHCQICIDKTPYQSNDNLISHAKVEIRPEVELQLDAEQFKCHHCNKLYKNKLSLQKHICQVHNPHKKVCRLKCIFCKCEFNCKSQLQQHLQQHFKCEHCESTSSDHSTKIKNIELPNHRKKQSFTCLFCSKVFTNTHLLEFHIATHSWKKPILCEHCGKQVSTKSSLKRHMETHSACNVKIRVVKRQTYRCNLCPRKYYTVPPLLEHLRKCH